MKCSSVGFASSTLLCLALGDKAKPSMRHLIRGRSSILHNQGFVEDMHLLKKEDVDDERDLGRVKARNDGGGISNSSGSSSKGSKGTKGSSSESKGSKRDGGRRHRHSGPSCGIGCGDKDFAYIYLEGSYFFRGLNDDSVDVVPIEGTGRLNTTKDGSTIRILDQDLKGYAKYFDHGDADTHKNDIHGSVSGSCTLLATFEGATTQAESELCLAHCTICVEYEGQCCQDSKPYESEWDNHCETYGGYATMTADLLFALEFRNGTGSTLISIPEGGLVSLEGIGPITGTALELNSASNGGLGYIEYDALDRNAGDVYKIGLKVPFNYRASCKLQSDFKGFDIPQPDTIQIPVPLPALPILRCNVQITCQAEDEIECNAFSVPTLACASSLSQVRFQYTGGDCSDSNNDQRDDVCEDTNGGPPADTEVLVQCLDSESNAVLASELLSPGGTIDVAGEGGGLLPGKLECRVSSTDESSLYQTLFFGTTQRFFAKSVYGSLEVESCDALECIIDVAYSYTATNAGEAPINITSMTRVRDGDTLDLTDQVDPKELDVGEKIVVTEPDQVDYCVTSSITTEVMISSNGEECLIVYLM
jgi:hypothetical protein